MRSTSRVLGWTLALLVGLWASARSASAHCTEAGTCHNASDDCVPATEGYWSDGEICRPCEPGRFSVGTASTECLLCPLGSYSASVAATACLPCAEGTVADERGSVACEACPAGQQPNEAQSACVCEAGHHADGAGSCAECPAGTSAAEPGATSCAPCDDGTYSLGAATACTACGDCDDGNDGTVDRCDPSEGCVHAGGDAAPAATDGGIDPPSDGGGCSVARRRPFGPVALLLVTFLVATSAPCRRRGPVSRR